MHMTLTQREQSSENTVQDKEGILGVFLRRNVVAVAGRAMSKNLRKVAPLVLPYTELVRIAVLVKCLWARVYVIASCSCL